MAGGGTFLLHDLQTPLKLVRGKVWIVETCHRIGIMTHTKFHWDQERGTEVRGGIFLPNDLQTPLKLDRGKVWIVESCHRSGIMTRTKFHSDRERGTKVRGWGDIFT